MAIEFPASPSVNDTFTAGSITYKWDGDKWIGLGVTPADRLVEGSNSLEIDANNNLIWSGNNVGVNTSSPGVRFQVDYNEGAGERGLRLRAYNATNSKSWNISEITGNAGVLTFTNSTNGVDALSLVGSTGLGNTGAVLVGTTTYADGDTNQSRLVVEGNVSSDASYGGILLRRGISSGVSSGTSLGRIFFGDQTGDAGARISGLGDGAWSSGSYPGRIEFDTKPAGSDTWSNRMTIDSDGNVGIGHSTPASKLTIGGDAISTVKPTVAIVSSSGDGSLTLRGGSPTLVFDQTGGGNGRIVTDAVDLVVYNGTLDAVGTENLRIHTEGYITAPRQPAWHARMTANNWIGIGGDIVPFDVAVVDTVSAYDTTNYNYVVPVTGIYHVYYRLARMSDSLFDVGIYVNGSQRYEMEIRTAPVDNIGNANWISHHDSVVMALSSGQEVDIRINGVIQAGTAQFDGGSDLWDGFGGFLIG